MLASETNTLAEAHDSLVAQIDALESHLDDLDGTTDEAAAIRDQRNRLQYFKQGIEWHAPDLLDDVDNLDDVDRDDAWGADTTVTIGALTGGEEAMMHREIPADAEEKERRNWYVAAATESAPYVDEKLDETFANVADLHPAFIDWARARSNALGVAGNRFSTSSTASESSRTSTTKPDSTT